MWYLTIWSTVRDVLVWPQRWNIYVKALVQHPVPNCIGYHNKTGVDFNYFLKKVTQFRVSKFIFVNLFSRTLLILLRYTKVIYRGKAKVYNISQTSKDEKLNTNLGLKDKYEKVPFSEVLHVSATQSVRELFVCALHQVSRLLSLSTDCHHNTIL